MKTYKIELIFTNPYIGSRHGGNRIIEAGLSFAKAKEWLLDKHNELFENPCTTFLSAINRYRRHKTLDGLYRGSEGYRLDYDSRIFKMVTE
jgi:hypothetical protein